MFLAFGLEMCLAPQRRALFRHRNFQKWSERGVLLLFLLANVLCATTARNFFISHLASWLRTRRFSEVTFRPSGAPNHWKNTVNRGFPTFLRTRIFLLPALSLFCSSLIFSLLFFSSLTLPTSAIPSVHVDDFLTTSDF